LEYNGICFKEQVEDCVFQRQIQACTKNNWFTEHKDLEADMSIES